MGFYKNLAVYAVQRQKKVKSVLHDLRKRAVMISTYPSCAFSKLIDVFQKLKYCVLLARAQFTITVNLYVYCICIEGIR